MIPYKNRFHKKGAVRYVYLKGDIFRSKFVTLKVVKSRNPINSRVAVVISKKTHKSAVKRNRIRRRLYGYIETRMSDLSGVYDIVLIVTSSEIISLSPSELRALIDELFTQADLYKSN